MILGLSLLFVIIFLLFMLSWVWPPDSPWSPWWRTSETKARQILKFAKVTKKDILYELGSGEGKVLLTAAKELGAKGVGIEIDPLRWFLSTLMIRIIRVQDKVKIKRKNLFDEDLSQASVIFVYLVPKTLQKLKPKFLKELKKGTRIISLKYPVNLPLLEKDEENKLFLYKI